MTASGAMPPVNDDFANRTFLQGSSITFTGTVVGATVEPQELWASSYNNPKATIWWSWTASETSPVIVQVLEVAGASFGDNSYSSLCVWHPTDLALGFPTNDFPQYALDRMDFDPGMLRCSLVFTGYQGSAYQIQLDSSNPLATYKFALIATNTPIIFSQPRDVRIQPAQCALFTVDAAGVLPLYYQWRFNGTNISGATRSFFGVTNASLGSAGDYSVLVSNATGVCTSSVAHLSINQNETAPSLSALGVGPSNQFLLALQGDQGRYYRVETSTDLGHWLPEPDFPMDPTIAFYPYPKPLTSVIFPSEFPAVLSVTATNLAKYVHVSRYAPSNEVCNLFLKQIRHVKNVWARETRHSLTDTPSDTEIFVVPAGKPVCPSGGFYHLDTLGSPPRCTYGHKLEEPR